ncbi:NTP transferase domain-containing protein [Cyanothece sp. BG0011]|uniref:nucleotidyltransferase family protein n=1 Tax=Cyanothece sp. BG0011 TaxID=2082950 RepID=UPI000D1E95AE|nr:nucleotidyltransferase family protein [Cyanothece sp. BG0011]
MNQKVNIAVIILAAGASTRMGTAKQLLSYQGATLLSHTIETAIASICKPIIVVLGANEDKIKGNIDRSSVTVIKNKNWSLGMGSSIGVGIKYLSHYPQTIKAAVICVCDQPFLTAEIINNLVFAYQTTRKPIIVCTYANTYGVPVLFDAQFFSQLVSLNGKGGAKKIIKQYKNDVSFIPFPQGMIDIDTPEDYQQLT